MCGTALGSVSPEAAAPRDKLTNSAQPAHASTDWNAACGARTPRGVSEDIL
jgi:hypothetical protein